MLSITFALILFTVLSSARLFRRDSTTTCTGIQAQSNNGDRKIAIVIDSSESMDESDPGNLRLEAGKEVLDWLIPQNASTATKKPDLVTVINFNETANLDYPLGDPNEAAYAAVAGIVAEGDTYIAGGVEMAIAQITTSGSGDTANRSGIIVFTDGEDLNTDLLVEQINDAANLGIRVSFSFLSESEIFQNDTVLTAIMDSGGRYFTIYDETSLSNFVNGIIVNGLTTNDNPNGDQSLLFAGLDASNFISGSDTVTMTYYARSKEILEFSVTSLDAGSLSAKAVFNGKTLATSSPTDAYDYGYNYLSLTAPSDGKIDIEVTAQDADPKSIFVVGVTSNLPAQNCTVAVVPPTTNGHGGMGPKEIVEIAVPSGLVALLLTSMLLYLLRKHLRSKGEQKHNQTEDGSHPSSSDGVQKTPEVFTKEIPQFPTAPSQPPISPSQPLTAPPSSFGTQNLTHSVPLMPPAAWKPSKSKPRKNNDEDSDSDYSDEEDDLSSPTQGNQSSDHHRLHRVKERTYGDNHHHHLHPNHPCFVEKCPLASNGHNCEDPYHPCTCVDPKCKVNYRKHKCKDENNPHICAGPGKNPSCPLNDPEYSKVKKREHDELVTKYMAQDFAKKTAKSGAKAVVRHTVNMATGGGFAM